LLAHQQCSPATPLASLLKSGRVISGESAGGSIGQLETLVLPCSEQVARVPPIAVPISSAASTPFPWRHGVESHLHFGASANHRCSPGGEAAREGDENSSCFQLGTDEWAVEVVEDDLAEWLHSIRWQPMRLCLQHTLLQVTQCFAESRFELRRMADQVMRPLAEVALWGDLPVLQQLWGSFLPQVDSLPCWVAASTLLLVLQRTSGFQSLLQYLPSLPSLSTTAAPTAAAASALAHKTITTLVSIVQRVEDLVPSLLPSVSLLVDRATSDKVSVLAAQLVILTHSRFGGRLPLLRRQQAIHIESLFRLIATLYRDAHPPRDEGELAEGGGGVEFRRGPISAVGGMAASAVTASMLGGALEDVDTTRRSLEHARLVERSLVSAVRAELPALAYSLSLQQRGQLLPWLLAKLRMPPTVQCVPSLLEALEACLQPAPTELATEAEASMPAYPVTAQLNGHSENGDDRLVVWMAGGTKCSCKSSKSSGRRLFTEEVSLCENQPSPLPIAGASSNLPTHAPLAWVAPSVAAAEVCHLMAQFLAEASITMSTLRQSLRICRLAIAPASTVYSRRRIASAPSEEAFVRLLGGLCNCLRGHGAPSPPATETGCGSTSAELARLLSIHGSEMLARRLRAEKVDTVVIGQAHGFSTGSKAGAAPGTVEAAAGAAASLSAAIAPLEEHKEDDEQEEHEENEEDEEDTDDMVDEESDWDDWDDEDEAGEVVEAGPRYEDVGSFLWWFAGQIRGRYQLETSLPQLHEADAAQLLAAMRHAAKSDV